MHLYSFKTVLKTAECDPRQEIRLSSLVRLMQEAAIHAVEDLGYDHTKTLDRGLLWVIGKQYFQIARMPRYDEEIEVQTYPGKRLMSFFLRHYRILSSNGEVLVKGVAVWTLIDKKSRKMINPSHYGIEIPCDSMEGQIEFPPSYSFQEELPLEAKIEATYSRCDLNGHLNNTFYFDCVQDLIPIDYLKSHECVSINVSYKKEIPLGESAPIQYGIFDSRCDFQSDHFQIRLEYR
ncbi:MAG: thioesterase [Mollicutes bacterium]|nr:thioesterase [bacterium]MDD6801300.1 thioesterase [Mollicutes bacterium]MDD7063870.1 thioesterase [Mollicutes bacterium]MDY2686839.1 thioesterase [Candidatus Enteromonas sp.]MDY5298032.1 thioesterase [Candidatus Enteromonas sp.]